MTDIYKNFQELSEKEIEGVDYRIELEDRGTDTVIVGIHGGEIEPGTEGVVQSIAGTDLSFYTFLGNAERQHITSTNFDEPRGLDLVTKSKKVVSIHGKAGQGEFVMLGGLDKNLISRATELLTHAGFKVVPTTAGVAGNELKNICNRGSSGKGLQIEMNRGLRDSLVQDPARMEIFAQAVRNLV